jgi:hypothetical protein
MSHRPAGIDLVAGDGWGLSQAPEGHGIFIKARARFRGRSLDRALSRGEDPASSPVLTRRAAWLTSAKNRHALARSIRRLLDLPSGRRPGPSAAVPARAVSSPPPGCRSQGGRCSRSTSRSTRGGVARLQLLLTEGGVVRRTETGRSEVEERSSTRWRDGRTLGDMAEPS